MVFCKKLEKELENMAVPPFPGELGEKIFREISNKAWSMWLNHQTILINEYRLNLLDDKSKQFLMAEMEKFLFDTTK